MIYDANELCGRVTPWKWPHGLKETLVRCAILARGQMHLAVRSAQVGWEGAALVLSGGRCDVPSKTKSSGKIVLADEDQAFWNRVERRLRDFIQ